MKKTILFSIIIVLVVAAGVVFFMSAKRPSVQNSGAKSASGAVTINAAAKMPETNPFKTKVNPVEGYTNPFSK